MRMLGTQLKATSVETYLNMSIMITDPGTMAYQVIKKLTILPTKACHKYNPCPCHQQQHTQATQPTYQASMTYLVINIRKIYQLEWQHNHIKFGKDSRKMLKGKCKFL